MLNQQLLFMLSAGGAVAAIVFAVSRMLVGEKDTRLTNRLSDTRPTQSGTTSVTTPTGLKPLIQRIGSAAAEPFAPKNRETQATLRKRLGQAGIYTPGAARVVSGFKFILLIVGIAAGYAQYLFFGNIFLSLSLCGLAGYLAPTFWLKHRIKANQKALTQGLPDALDLMVVCVEAGLTVDSAMQRVGQELALAHMSLSREFGIAHMETRVGLSRMEALRNLGQRTDNPAIISLASMLIQAERFGTSIASALRIHADSLRVHRHQVAEELAAKASVKMSFPLVLFIFPATFIVLAGPTVIGLMKSALFTE